MREIAPGVTVLRSAERFRTDGEGIVTRHCFAFGQHYDPDNTGFGELTAINDELVDPGRGYDMHRHRDTEIVTWVLEGALRHEDSAGHAGTIGTDVIQRMSAGEGIRHAERNASDHAPVRFIQMWLRSHSADPRPSYAQADLATLLERPEFVLAVGPESGAAIGIGNPDAGLWIARLAEGASAPLPTSPGTRPRGTHWHVHVVRGAAAIGGAGMLEVGDTVRVTTAEAPPVTAYVPSEVLVWAMRPPS